MRRFFTRLVLHILYGLDQVPRRLLGTPKMTFFKRCLMRYIDRQDRWNRQVLSRILYRHGWIDRSTWGKRAADAAFLIAQHSPRAFLERHIRFLRDAVCRNEAEPKHLALMQDRLLMYRKRKQIYGTQRLTVGLDGPFKTWPIVKPYGVHARRAKVGLSPMAPDNLMDFMVIDRSSTYDRNEQW